MAVPIEAGPAFTAGAPQELFQAPFADPVMRGHYRPAPMDSGFSSSHRSAAMRCAGRSSAELDGGAQEVTP